MPWPLRADDPCLLRDRESGSALLVTAIRLYDEAVLVHHRVRGQMLVERGELAPGRWALPGTYRRRR